MIMKVDSVVGKAQIKVFVMTKGTYEYPKKSYDITPDSISKNFNISGTYFEYQVYVIPDTFTSGSYRINVYLEKAWQPKAFNDNEN